MNSLLQPITVSLCMIVRDEEASIANCLDCVATIVDEIIIVDTGSADRTKDIVGNYTDKVFDFNWEENFANARNFAFSKASKDYILWLDADDLLTQENQKKLLALKSNFDTAADSVNMIYILSRNNAGIVTQSLRRNRLVRRICNFRWIGAVHEYLAVHGNIVSSDIAITHNKQRASSDRNLRIYERRLTRGERFSPRDIFYFANELHDHQQLERAIYYYQRFLGDGHGWKEDNISACDKLADCYRQLREFDLELHYLLKSFEYDLPRAEFCCHLGNRYFQSKDYQKAIFWFHLAINRGITDQNHTALIDHASNTWLPHVQLCFCYDQLGDYKLANEHNELAAHYIPSESCIEHNRKYFAQKIALTE